MQGGSTTRAHDRPWHDRVVALPRHRRRVGLLLVVSGLSTVTMLLLEFRGRLDLTSILLLYLLAVVGVASVGGIWPGVAAALAASALSNWFWGADDYVTKPFGMNELLCPAPRHGAPRDSR